VNEPQIHLTGNLAFDPNLRTTPNGVSVLDLRVASTQRRKVGEEWQDGETLWFDVACWKQLAENASTSLHKGDRVTVSGRLAQKSWTKEDGTTGVKLVIDATAVGVDLSRYPVTVAKPVRESAAEGAFGWAHMGTGEIVDAPTGDPGPLVPFDVIEEAEEVAA
jgi:single-strand DNA-binding protein